MSTYRMQDGTVVKTENATRSWKEDKNWDGSNWISVHTGSQWAHERLHISRKGRYWLERTSQYSEGAQDRAEWISPQEATRWLVLNDNALPNDLKEFERAVTE